MDIFPDLTIIIGQVFGVWLAVFMLVVSCIILYLLFRIASVFWHIWKLTRDVRRVLRAWMYAIALTRILAKKTGPIMRPSTKGTSL